MAGTYREIDYRIRPAKYTERLMLADALRRLKFGTVESYQYVGLGSVYFTDFVLFHRALGINKMVSIEKEEHDKPRFLDNLPFSNIEMQWGLTTKTLPFIDLSLRTIAWFDYDGRLTGTVLDDVRSFVTRATTGSVLIVTVQCQPERFDDKNSRRHMQTLAQELGGDRVDPGLDDRALLGWNAAELFRKIIRNEIDAALEKLNGVRPDAQKMEFEQIFYFQYKDGAQMLTVGGVLFDRGQRPIFDSCAFRDLDFVRTGEKRDQPFRIEIPKLTPREMKILERQMPLLPDKDPVIGTIPEQDAKQYVRIYRYFANLAVVDL
jgi:hypothetical protein